MAYKFDLSIDTGKWTIEIDSAANYGYIERNSNGDGGALWFNSNKELIDYDGVYELTDSVIKAIESLGYNADYAKDSD